MKISGKHKDSRTNYVSPHDQLYSFYDKIIKVCDSAVPKGVYIFGGRGLGKTTLLQRVFQNHGMDEATKISLRTESDLIKRLNTFIENPTSFILIDDFDRIRTKIEESGLDFEDFIFLLQRTLSVAKKIVSTGTMTLSEVLKIFPDKDIWSNMLSIFDVDDGDKKLDPWRGNWDERIRNQIDIEFNILRSDDTRKKRSKGPALPDMWTKIVLSLSGGHPALTGPSLIELHRLITAKRDGTYLTPLEECLISIEKQPACDFDLKKLITSYLEDHLILTGMKYIERAIDRFRLNPSSEYREAYKKLIEIAHSTIEEEHDVCSLPNYEVPSNIREILKNEGLVYVDHREKSEGVLRIPGSLVKEEIRRSSIEPRQIEASLALEPDESSGRKGRLLVKSGIGKVSVTIAGGPWLILQFLYKNRGRVCSIPEMKKNLELGSELAIRSALQRLEAKLKANRIIGAIENLRGEGYRLGNSIQILHK